MGEGFHLLHVPLVGDGQRELRLFQGHNHGASGGGGAVGWSFQRSFVFLLDNQVVPCIGQAWRVTCVCPRNSSHGRWLSAEGLSPGPRPPAPSSSLGQGRVGTCGGPRRLLSCLTQPWEPPGRRSCLAD